MSPIIDYYKREIVNKLVERDTSTDGNNNTGIVDDDPFSSSSWAWGRWILFVIFVVFILILVFCTARVNRRRRVMGQQPIRGTAWLTPPSYRQSERQYNGSQEYVEDFVPEYTETANDQDLGYYDARGEFHPNSKVDYLPPPQLGEETLAESSNSVERPPNAVVRDRPDTDLDFRRPTTSTFVRPNHPPPNTANSSPGGDEETEMSDFRRPDYPPNQMNTHISNTSASTDDTDFAGSSIEIQDVIAEPKKVLHRDF
ncbi:Rcr2p NDAI_0A06560 [Naumovozyma dairenensis CBS 421]|uniref:Uncharacterized protein n=1 Tax=Naumovozyma dairenensis (strain ATCC 10597 / BCRC 20456 / CBS 421 / NBRC 0211 / NRRL Y-12639) TaxID=1071378 RepID=G0W4S2_NAUDC|nr:hypothetical protein NDAI_0A06560 [Naumovozyma dairenensis CBS 421]CCD22810.1 hypothetical protein NDAI_0A06560 [Naumovozyma dairenensis CBS 421]